MSDMYVTVDIGRITAGAPCAALVVAALVWGSAELLTWRNDPGEWKRLSLYISMLLVGGVGLWWVVSRG